MKILALFFFLCSLTVVKAQTDEEAIKSVVTSAYVEGIHNRGNVEDIRKGFHPSFNMLRLSDNQLKPMAIEEWISSLEKAKKENPAAPPRAEARFISIDMTGTAAVVELGLYRENKKIFTDYLALYKFSEGWRIVSKIFYRHP
jgi:hypothetical protein